MTSIRSAVTLLVALTLSLAGSVAAQPLSGPEFIPLATPCRALDTRVTGTPLQANVPRTIQIGGACGVPTTAAGAELNFTITQAQGPGHMAAWPSGALPATSAVNFVPGEDTGNAIDIGLGAGGTVIVQSIVNTHLVVDVYGYFTDVEVLPGFNTALGAFALTSNTTGANNTALGFNALTRNTTGANNTATGDDALFFNTTGANNTATGGDALFFNTTGGANTALGVGALGNNTTGNNNTAVGRGALGNNIGTGNTALGFGAGSSVTTGNNNIHISNFGTATDSGRIRIGTVNQQTATFISGIRFVITGVDDALAVLIDGAGQLGTTNSSRRVKTDIHDLGDQSRALHQLRPVSFRYRSHPPDGRLEYGLIAEEVAEIYPDLVVRDKDGLPAGVRYHVLPAMLLNELQREQRERQAEKVQTEARLAAQQQEIDELRAQVRALVGTKAARE